MLKVLIADDEPYVREGIKNIVPWDECGFDICGEGIDGDDTYKKIFDLSPDLVLIDIRMPGKLGLDVIRESIENGFKGKFIIISGYSDFQYAKLAIKYGVKSYLLKPIDEDELYDIAINLKKEIEDEKNKIRNIEIQKKYVKEYSLSQLMLGKKVDDYEELRNYLDSSNYTVALVLNYDEKTKNENLIELESCVKNRLNNIDGVEVCKVKDKVAILFCDVNSSHSLNILNRVSNEVSKSLNGRIFLTVGKNVNSIDDIILSYTTANELMKTKFLFLEEAILTAERVRELSKKEFLFSEMDIINKIFTYVEIGENIKIKELLKSLKEVIQSKFYTEDQIKILITKSCLEFYDKIKNDYEVDRSLILDKEVIIKDIYNTESLQEIIEVLEKGLISISKVISFNSSDKSIKRIVKYIENNYYTDLKLELLAEIFNYNSAYLGKVFKNNTGMSFNTYLDTIRIEQAKKLLMEDKLKVYQVCEKVGYKNIDYFHSKFKKYVGVSPLNYKKQVESGKVKELV